MHQRLATIIKSKKSIVLAGAGVSIATSENSLSGWNGLLRHALTLCQRHFPDTLTAEWLVRRIQDLEEGTVFDKMNIATQVMHWFSRLGPDMYPRWVEDTVGKLSVKHPALIKAMGALNVPIATTNYDTLIEKVLARELATWDQAQICSQIIKGKSKSVLHVHGCWKNPHTMIMDLQSYQQITGDDFIQTLMRSIEYNHAIIFIGFGSGMDDPHFQAFLNWAKGKFLNPQTQHFILVRAKETPVGLPENIIPVVYGDDYADLPRFLELLAPRKRKTVNNSKFRVPKKKAPLTDQAALRPETLHTGLPSMNLYNSPAAPVLTSVESFQRHTNSNQELTKDVFLLTVLPCTDRKILGAYWRRRDVETKLKELTARCPFINNGDMDPLDRMAFRRDWHNYKDPVLLNVLEQLETIMDAQKPVRVESSEYFNWYIQFLGVQGWKHNVKAIPELVKGLLTGVLIDEDCWPVINLAKELLEIYPEETAFAEFLENKSFDGLSSLQLESTDFVFLENLALSSWTPRERTGLYFILGYAYTGKGDYRMGVHYFDLAFTLSDNFFPQGKLLARAYLDAVSAVLARLEDPALLANCLQWIDKFSFSSCQAPRELGGIYYLAKQYELAVGCWHQYLEECSGDVTTWNLLLRTLSEHCGKREEAIKLFNRAPQAIRKVPFLQLLIGYCYAGEKDYNLAKQYYKDAAICEGSARCDAFRELAELHDGYLDDQALANSYYEQGLKEKASSYDMLRFRISYLDFLLEEGRQEEALEGILSIEKLLRDNFDRMTFEDLNNVAWYLYELNTQLDLAERLSRRAVELRRHESYVCHTLASVLVQLNKWEEAVPHLRSWLDLSNEWIVKEDWRNHVFLFRDIVAQKKQAEMQALITEKSSKFWLSVHCALYLTTGQGDKSGVPTELMPLTKRLCHDFITDKPPGDLPA